MNARFHSFIRGVLVGAAVIGGSSLANAATIQLRAWLNGAQEVPPVATSATMVRASCRAFPPPVLRPTCDSLRRRGSVRSRLSRAAVCASAPGFVPGRATPLQDVRLVDEVRLGQPRGRVRIHCGSLWRTRK